MIATACAKACTQPLIGYFVAGPSYDEANLIGATCEVSTSEATPEFGQAKFRTNAAPLLPNVRTDVCGFAGVRLGIRVWAAILRVVE